MANYDSILLREHPLQVLPSLAVKVGLNEAIILQQVRYWLGKSKIKKQGRPWVYNTYEQWQEQFPFFSIATIKRAILSLEQQGLLISAQLNNDKRIKTKYYTINFDAVGKLAEKLPSVDDASDQIDTMEEIKMIPSSGSKCTDLSTETSSEISSETTKNTLGSLHEPSASETYPPEFEQCWQAYPKRDGSNPKRGAYKAWMARLKQGEDVRIMTAGAERYAAYCRARDMAGSRFVMQAKTFFGPGKHYLEEWDTKPHKPAKPKIADKNWSVVEDDPTNPLSFVSPDKLFGDVDK